MTQKDMEEVISSKRMAVDMAVATQCHVLLSLHEFPRHLVPWASMGAMGLYFHACMAAYTFVIWFSSCFVVLSLDHFRHVFPLDVDVYVWFIIPKDPPPQCRDQHRTRARGRPWTSARSRSRSVILGPLGVSVRRWARTTEGEGVARVAMAMWRERIQTRALH